MKLKQKDVVRRVPGLTARRLEAWIARGWVSPARGANEPVYEEIDVARIELIRQLRDEMEIGREAVPVLLSLMDQLYGLRHEMRCVAQALGEQPTEVRESVIARFRAYRAAEPD